MAAIPDFVSGGMGAGVGGVEGEQSGGENEGEQGLGNAAAPTLEEMSIDDTLSPIERMRKYARSDLVLHRLFVAKDIADTIREIGIEELPYDVLPVIENLMRDPEPIIRQTIIMQLPTFASILIDRDGDAGKSVVVNDLLRLLMPLFTDTAEIVHFAAEASLCQIMNTHQLNASELEATVCPFLLKFATDDLEDEHRMNALVLMSKCAKAFGKPIVERLFIPQFCNLSEDALFRVRKSCAFNLGGICAAAGTELTIEKLLPRFVKLCSDKMWGVRKSCAESLHEVSRVVTPEIRNGQLVQIFENLASDQSRWVRSSAFQFLGQFIATFADETVLSAKLSRLSALDEHIIPKSPIISSPSVDSKGTASASPITPSTNAVLPTSLLIENAQSLQGVSTGIEKMSLVETASFSDSSADIAASTSLVSYSTPDALKPSDEFSTFNSFTFWRAPLPVLDIDLSTYRSSPFPNSSPSSAPSTPSASLSPSSSSSSSSSSSASSALLLASSTSPVSPASSASVSSSSSLSTGNPALGAPLPISSKSITFLDGQNESNLAPASSSGALSPLADLNDPELTVDLPPKILEFYIQMAEPASTRSIDNDIGYHCAFSLPAVTLLIGSQKWPLIRETFFMLSRDMQWKVRRSLAHSLHIIGGILGQEVTQQDLQPVFDLFLRDLDEVRVGVVKHFAQFLSLLSEASRRQYLPMLEELQHTENSQNWRFRRLLAKQMDRLALLFSPAEVKHYLCPVISSLVSDPVAAVRRVACRSMAVILDSLQQRAKRFASEVFEDNANPGVLLPLPVIVQELCVHVIENFSKSPMFISRLTYITICKHLLHILDGKSFTETFLPSLLNLARDKVPNVRIATAWTLTQHAMTQDYFVNLSNTDKLLADTLFLLQHDTDKDVSYYASLPPGSDSQNPLVLGILKEEDEDFSDCITTTASTGNPGSGSFI